MIVTLIHMFSVDSSILCFTGMFRIHYVRDIVDELCYYQHSYVMHRYSLSLTIQTSEKQTNTSIGSMYVSYIEQHNTMNTFYVRHLFANMKVAF